MAVIAPIVSTFDPKGVNKAERAFDGLRDNTSKALGKIADAAKIAATAVAGIGVAGVVGAVKAINKASDLEEAISKVGVIFGDSAGDVEKFAQAAAGNFGQSQQAALDAASTFATFGKAAGLAGDDLFGFSTDFVALASDLASFNNTSPEDAVQAIGAALRGESEPLRRYGVLLDDATLKAEALALGIYDGEGALTAQQKTLAAEQAIYRQTADAQGDFARTSDGLANSQRILRARLDNVVAEIGKKLLPVALKVAEFFGDKVLPAIEKVSAAFSEDGLAGVFRLVSGIIKTEGPKIVDAGRELLERLGNWMVDTGLPWLGRKLAQLGQALVDWIGPRIRPALEKLGELIGRLAQWFVDEGAPKLAAKLEELGQQLVDWIKPRVAPAIQELGNLLARIGVWVLTDALPKLASLGLQLGGKFVEWTKTLGVEALRGLGLLLGDLGRWVVNTGLPKLGEWGTLLGGRLVDFVTTEARKLPDRLLDAAVSLGSWGRDLGRSAINGLIAIWNRANLTFPRIEVPSWVPSIGGKGFGGFDIFPDVPYLARGGIVDSPTLAVVGDRRLSQGRNTEAVVPLDQMGGGITINVTGALDPVAVARQIRQLLERDAARLGLRTAV